MSAADDERGAHILGADRSLLFGCKTRIEFLRRCAYLLCAMHWRDWEQMSIFECLALPDMACVPPSAMATLGLFQVSRRRAAEPYRPARAVADDAPPKMTGVET